jgi:hypothetical protein
LRGESVFQQQRIRNSSTIYWVFTCIMNHLLYSYRENALPCNQQKERIVSRPLSNPKISESTSHVLSSVVTLCESSHVPNNSQNPSWHHIHCFLFVIVLHMKVNEDLCKKIVFRRKVLIQWVPIPNS